MALLTILVLLILVVDNGSFANPDEGLYTAHDGPTNLHLFLNDELPSIDRIVAISDAPSAVMEAIMGPRRLETRLHSRRTGQPHEGLHHEPLIGDLFTPLLCPLLRDA